MAFCELHYFSESLRKQTAANVIAPQDGTGPFPVLYLLHGLSDDYTMWMRRTNLERYVEGWPLIVVMPDGGRGFYTDAEQGFAHERAIVRDLVPFIDRMFNTRAERGGRAVVGLSMGGYGAMKFALKFPAMFCAAASYSGALTKGHVRREDETIEFDRIFGAKAAGGPNDLFALAEKIDRAQLPALRIDCGTEDFLLDRSQAFHAHLERLGIPHDYAEFSGGHDWNYWDARIRETLPFFYRQFELGGAA